MNMNKKITAGFLAVTLLSLLPALTMADAVTVTADVDKYITATFQYSAVGFGALASDSHDNEPIPANTVGEYNVTVGTNYEYKVSAQVTLSLNDGLGHTIDASNMKMDVDSVAGSLSNSTATTLDGNVQEIEGNIANTVTDSFNGFWVSVDAGQYAGAYSGTVAVTYANE